VPFKHIVNINHIVNDWVTVAEQFLNVPYRWGGRDSIGVDCSALIQLSLETVGIIFPRDTKFQILENYEKTTVNNIKRGSIVFWEGHTGVMTDKKNFLHSNSFHMKTIIEPFKEVFKRSKIINRNIISIITIF
jgi:cell wall-associated NlpC family hydrolase